MRVLKIFSVFITVAGFFSSCDRCGYLECATNDIPGKFRIVSASTGKDLLFGTGSMYNKNQLKFYAVKGTDTTYYSFYSNAQGQGLDSALFVSFFPKSDMVYMRLNSSDVDTFFITYTTVKSRCCGLFDNIHTLKHNNIDVPVNDGLIVLKK